MLDFLHDQSPFLVPDQTAWKYFIPVGMRNHPQTIGPFRISLDRNFLDVRKPVMPDYKWKKIVFDHQVILRKPDIKTKVGVEAIPEDTDQGRWYKTLTMGSIFNRQNNYNKDEPP